MQTRQLIRATIRVANTTDMSGTAPADEINRGLRTGKKRSLGRITGLPGLGFLLVVGLFVTLAPIPARAAEGGVPAEIAALKAQVAALQSIVGTLQTNNSALQSEVNKLQTQLAAVQSNNALKLGPFVSVASGLINGVNGPHIFFTGANIHIVSGSTTTADSVTGLGNLIIGYDEVPNGLMPGDRGGAHNLVIGRENRFTQAAFGGLVVGELNTISNKEASVTGGTDNTASGLFASVSGGDGNHASADFASVSGGDFNTASGAGASVSGGHSNTASGAGASVSGGFDATASGQDASVTGGGVNSANGVASSITGGVNNRTSGFGASVTGGSINVAGGSNTVVIGGRFVTDNNNDSIAPQPPFP